MTLNDQSSTMSNFQGRGAYSGSHFQDVKDTTFIAAERVYMGREEADTSNHEIRRLADWLKPINFRTIHYDTLSKCTSGTGGWFISSVEFKQWLAGKQGVLWIQGIPGAGKTILASIIINYLLHMDVPPDRNPDGVVFLYCRHDEKRTIAVYLTSLVIQLVQNQSKNTILLRLVSNLWDLHSQGGTQPSKAELANLLRNMFPLLNKVYVILDALDEVPERDQVELIAGLISMGGCLLLTSRHMGVDIFDLPHDTLHVSVGNLNEADINTFLHERVKGIPSVSRIIRGNKAFMEEICDKIVSMSKGMFLLASLRMESLQGSSTMNRLSNTLDSLPNDIDAIYQSAVERINNQDGDYALIAKRAITWVLYAGRTLKFDELQHALVIQDLHTSFNDRDVPPHDLLTAVSCGMIEIQPNSGDVRLIHYTAYDFFKRDPSLLILSPHAYIGTSCISYLTSFGFTQLEILTMHEFDNYLATRPLLNYAYFFWTSHVEECYGDTYPEQIVSNFILQTINYPIWVNSWNIEWSKPVHVVAYHGLRIPLPWKELCNERATNNYTPLLLAAMNNCSTIIASLLSCINIDINAQTSQGDTALILASRNGHNSAVMAFLSSPKVNINLWNDYGATALITASEYDHHEIVKTLLSFPGIDVNAQDDHGSTALMHSVQYECHDQSAQALLLFPAIGINMQDGGGETALINASRRGYHNIVKPLLSFPEINVNIQNHHGSTALTVASQYGHDEVVKTFLSFPGIDINLMDADGDTALICACLYDRQTVAETLLTFPGIDINVRNKKGQTALSIASEKGCGGVVDILLSFTSNEHN